MKRQATKKAPGNADKSAAEEVAVRALAFLADDPRELDRFLALTGIEPAEIRSAAQQPGFLAGVLEYICAHEPLLLGFARNTDLEPTDIEAALEVLAGTGWSRDVP